MIELKTTAEISSDDNVNLSIEIITGITIDFSHYQNKDILKEIIKNHVNDIIDSDFK